MEISTVGIVGSGIMGSGIAEVAASSGYQVVLRSRRLETAESMVAGVAKSLDRQVAKEKRSAEEAVEILGRIKATTELADLADCDLVIESVVDLLSFDLLTEPRA